jgi:hypothetical protein
MILLLRRRANYRALVSLPQQRNTSHLIPPHTEAVTTTLGYNNLSKRRDDGPLSFVGLPFKFPRRSALIPRRSALSGSGVPTSADDNTWPVAWSCADLYRIFPHASGSDGGSGGVAYYYVRRERRRPLAPRTGQAWSPRGPRRPTLSPDLARWCRRLHPWPGRRDDPPPPAKGELSRPRLSSPTTEYLPSHPASHRAATRAATTTLVSAEMMEPTCMHRGTRTQIPDNLWGPGRSALSPCLPPHRGGISRSKL